MLRCRMNVVAPVLLYASISLADDNLDASLLAAVKSSDLLSVKSLIAAGANPNATNIKDRDCYGDIAVQDPPLIVAAQLDSRKEILAYLLDHGGDIELKSEAPNCPYGGLYHRTPILEASYRATYSTFKILLDRGANLEVITTVRPTSVLAYAVGAPPLATDAKRIADSLWNKVSQTVLENGFHKLFSDGANITYPAQVRNYLDLFLSHGVSIDSVAGSGLNRSTLLITALRDNNDDIITLALDRGANPNFTPNGREPSLYAMRGSESVEITLLNRLIAYGAKPSLEPLRQALLNQHQQTVELLLGTGMNLNSTIGGVPLFWTGDVNSPLISRLKTEQLKYLIDKGIDFKSYYESRTPLLEVSKSRFDLARVLINAGAPINDRNLVSGDTPVTLSIQFCNDPSGERLAFYRENGADVTIPNSQNQTALLLVTKLLGLSFCRETLTAYRDLITATGMAINIQEATALNGVLHKIPALLRGPEASIWVAAIDDLLPNANLNLQNRLGETPLILMSCQSSDNELLFARALLKAGADQTLRDSNHRTARELAIYCANTRFVDLLNEYPSVF